MSDESKARWALDREEAAESTEPRNQPEPLPTMTGDEIAAALEIGRSVERLWDGRWVELRSGDAEARWWRLHLGLAPVVARVVEPSAPATERVPLAFVRGRRLPDGRLVDEVRENVLEGGWWVLADGANYWHVAAPIPVDDDGTVEVLTEGTDKP